MFSLSKNSSSLATVGSIQSAFLLAQSIQSGLLSGLVGSFLMASMYLRILQAISKSAVLLRRAFVLSTSLLYSALMRSFRRYSSCSFLRFSSSCRRLSLAEYYDLLHISEEKQTEKTLLTENFKAIKEARNLIPAFMNIKPKDYPHSIKKIRRHLLEKINDSISC